MAKLSGKSVILAKIETTYGTDSVPTGAANAILVKDIDITPIAATEVSRDLVRATLGNSDTLIANKHAEITFTCELVGSGTLGTAPAYGPLLRACAMAETITAGTKVEYKPVSANFEAVSIHCYRDGTKHIITGSRGTCEVDVTANAIPTIKFTMVGIYNQVVDAAMPTTSYAAFKYPKVANTTNTTGFSLFGVSNLVLSSFKFTEGITTNFRSLIGSEYAQVAERASTAELMIEAPALATFDAFATALGSTTGAVTISHDVSPQKVTFSLPNADLGTPTYSDDNGILMLTLPMNVMPATGDDEFTLTFA